MKTTFTLIGLLFIALPTFSQVYVGDITLNTQAQVDNFSTNYPGITYIDGNLNISSNMSGDISDLSGLNQLTGARDLLIQDSGLSGWIPTQGENLTMNTSELGFDQSPSAIETFTSGFVTLNNVNVWAIPFEEDLTPRTLFENLVSVNSLSFNNQFPVTVPNLNTANIIEYYSYLNQPLFLPSVTSLNSLFCYGFGLSDQYSTPIFTSLTHLDYFQNFDQAVIDGFVGLASLTSIGHFNTWSAFSMNSVEGLANVQTADIIELWGYSNQQDGLIGLESLQNINILTIGSSNLVGDLSSLSNLQTVGTFEIKFTSGINSLAGIENLTITDYLEIWGENLSLCSVPSVCNFISSNSPEDYYIDSGNVFGCASDTEILASCGDPSNSTIFGSIYFDSNCNGLIDENEFTISPSYITVTPPNSTLIGISNFLTNVSPQTTITLSAANLPSQYIVGTPLTLTTPEFGGTINNQNILVCPAFDFNDLSVSILQFGSLVPGFTNIWKLQVDNIGASTVDFIPSITINSPELMASVNSLQGNFVNNIISWAATTISPGQTLEFEFHTTLLPTATILGETFSASAEVALVSGNDENPADNTALFEQEIIGSYDPNDKWVNTPQINIETIDPTQPLDLTYRVRFQNTGTAPAVNVRVEDILEDDLDSSTFQLLSSTHEVFYQIEGNQINFFFNDIMLPDSTSDPEGSIGTFFFRIKSNGNHTLESTIDNQVSIFFDFNEPIITNVASTIFYNCPVVNISGEGMDLCAGEEVELSAVAANNTSIQWFINEEVVSSSNNYLFSFDTPNDYSVLVVAENEYCFDEDELEITVNENPEVILIGDGNTLVATEGFASYQWTLDGNIIEGENGNTITSAVPGNYVVTVTNEFGCTDESDAVEIVDGINENESKAIVLWPNPVKDVVNIQSYYRGVATIVDTQGKQVMNITLNGQTTLDLSNLRSGVYQITSSIGMMGRFIKE